MNGKRRADASRDIIQQRDLHIPPLPREIAIRRVAAPIIAVRAVGVVARLATYCRKIESR
jgi:hypothetical protein